MTQNEHIDNHLTCAEFQAQMPDLIGSGESIASHPHLQTCDQCRALLADLESIAEAARQLFPIDDPPDSLWENIESAIKSDAPSEATELAVSHEDGAANPGLSPEPA